MFDEIYPDRAILQSAKVSNYVQRHAFYRWVPCWPVELRNGTVDVREKVAPDSGRSAADVAVCAAGEWIAASARCRPIQPYNATN
jgi:hypothetical protein